jgi:hypothetical protein
MVQKVDLTPSKSQHQSAFPMVTQTERHSEGQPEICSCNNDTKPWRTQKTSLEKNSIHLCRVVRSTPTLPTLTCRAQTAMKPIYTIHWSLGPGSKFLHLHVPLLLMGKWLATAWVREGKWTCRFMWKQNKTKCCFSRIVVKNTLSWVQWSEVLLPGSQLSVKGRKALQTCPWTHQGWGHHLHGHCQWNSQMGVASETWQDGGLSPHWPHSYIYLTEQVFRS